LGQRSFCLQNAIAKIFRRIIGRQTEGSPLQIRRNLVELDEGGLEVMKFSLLACRFERLVVAADPLRQRLNWPTVVEVTMPEALPILSTNARDALDARLSILSPKSQRAPGVSWAGPIEVCLCRRPSTDKFSENLISIFTMACVC
jgi:hypothetical protein